MPEPANLVLSPPVGGYPITISLFGSFQIQINGKPSGAFRLKKTRALLAYLLVEGSQPLLRTALAELFWPGYTPAAARASLRQSLDDLRNALAPFPLLHSTRDQIALQVDPAVVCCDALAFNALQASWQAHEHASLANCQVCRARLQQAVALIKGDFLANLPEVDSAAFVAWLQAQRTHFAEQLATAQAAQTQSASTPSNLRPALTKLIGRTAELTELATQLRDPIYRCLSLVGPGGIGKTRLALALGEQQKADFPDGVWLVELTAPAPSPALAAPEEGTAEQAQDRIATAIAATLGITFYGATHPHAQVATYLRDKTLLLLLDNFELVNTGAELLLHLLAAAPRLRLVVNSRQRLPFHAQLVHIVQGLATPPGETGSTPDLPTRYASVQLFIERAQNARFRLTLDEATLAAIGELCRLVHGSPWAIELAVAMLDHYTPAALLQALQADYRALNGGWLDLPPRLRSAETVLRTMWGLLTQHEATRLARCAVFRGGFTPAASQAIGDVSAADLQALVHKSLLHPVGAERFALHELVRQFAEEQLAHDPVAQNAVLARHAAYYLALFQAQEVALLNDFAAQGLIQSELDNIRAAWQWSATQGKLALVAQGAGALHNFYQLTGLYHEALQHLTPALAAVRQTVAATAGAAPEQWVLQVRLLCYMADFHRRIGAVTTGEQLAQEALAVSQRLDAPHLQALAYHELARLAQMRGDFLGMTTLAEQGCAQARQADAAELLAECLNDLASAVLAREHPLQAAAQFQAALACLAGTNNGYLVARITANLGTAYCFAHQYHLANQYLQDALSIQEKLQDQGNRAVTQIFIGTVAMAVGQYASAQAHYERVRAVFQTFHAPYWESWLYAHYGRLLHLRGDPAAARAACSLAQQITQQNGLRAHQQGVLLYLGHALTALGDWAAAENSYQQALALHQQIPELYFKLDTHAGLAALALQKNDKSTALHAVETALALLDQYGIAAAQEPFQVYWTCVCVLRANADPRADAVLRTAYAALQECAAQFEAEAVRQSFLEHVVVNRHLLAAARAASLA
ncbi:MAG: hypothetical protein U0350_41690 [Caldilineaceae bacterium]